VALVSAVLAVSLPYLLLRASAINAIAFAGDDAATSFGINVPRTRAATIFVSVALTAVVVSFTGVIGFVGLVGPHIARILIGSDHRYLLPFGAISGGLLLLVADTVGRTVLSPAVIPVGIVVALVGAPIFINLIFSKRATRL
jgi:iron complex transport system permease protein